MKLIHTKFLFNFRSLLLIIILLTMTYEISANDKRNEFGKMNADIPSDHSKSHQRDVLYYFHKLYPKGSGKPADELNFNEKDLKNGYLRVTGNMEGYFIYTLFRGELTTDWIIEQGTECGPHCEQKFRVYKFVNGQLSQKIKLENIIPKKKVDSHITNTIKRIPKGHTQENLQSWMKLPQFGTSIDILILEQNPGHFTGNVKVYIVGKLNWNRNQFNFLVMKPSEVSSIKISDVR